MVRPCDHRAKALGCQLDAFKGTPAKKIVEADEPRFFKEGWTLKPAAVIKSSNLWGANCSEIWPDWKNGFCCIGDDTISAIYIHCDIKGSFGAMQILFSNPKVSNLYLVTLLMSPGTMAERT